jgi:hypothetical protein
MLCLWIERTYLDYKNYLSNSLTATGVDIYPATLVAAINSVTKFHRGTKAAQPTNPSGTAYTALAALEGDRRANLELGETRNPSQIKTNRHPIPLLEERKTRVKKQRSSATTAANSVTSSVSAEGRRKTPPDHLTLLLLP